MWVKIQQKAADFFRANSGVAAIEAAIALPVFLVFILGIIGICHAVMIRQTMLYSLDVAGRAAMVKPNTSNEDLEIIAFNKMMTINPALLDVNVENSSLDGQDYKILSASYSYTFPALVGLSEVILDTSVTVPIN